MLTSGDYLFAEIDDDCGEFNYDGGYWNQGPNDSLLQRRHVINDTGEACLKTVKVTGWTDVACPIPVTTVEITSAIFRCKDGEGKCRHKIARKKESIQHIWSGKSKRIWLKTDTKNDTRKNVLHCRPRKSVMDHGEEAETRVLEVQVLHLGEFGPQGTRSSCFFVPFGLVKDTKEPTGVWVSTKYYSEVMVPKVASLGYGEKKAKEVLKGLLNSGQIEVETKEEEEEDEIAQTSEQIHFQSNQNTPTMNQPQQDQSQLLWNPFYHPVWHLPDFD